MVPTEPPQNQVPRGRSWHRCSPEGWARTAVAARLKQAQTAATPITNSRMVYKTPAFPKTEHHSTTMSHWQPNTKHVTLGVPVSGSTRLRQRQGRAETPWGTAVLRGGGGHIGGRGLGDTAELRQADRVPLEGLGDLPPEISRALTVYHCLRGHKTVSQAGGEEPGVVGRPQVLLKAKA